MTDKIIEAATACGIWVSMGDDKQKDVEALTRFYAIAYQQGLEASKAIAITTASPYGDKYGEGYNQSALDIEKRIDALMKEQQHG